MSHHDSCLAMCSSFSKTLKLKEQWLTINVITMEWTPVNQLYTCIIFRLTGDVCQQCDAAVTAILPHGLIYHKDSMCMDVCVCVFNQQKELDLDSVIRKRS